MVGYRGDTIIKGGYGDLDGIRIHTATPNSVLEIVEITSIIQYCINTGYSMITMASPPTKRGKL